MNIAHEAVDRHAAGARAVHFALRWLGKGGAVRDFSYADLSARSNRFANVLAQLGVGAGERVFVLAGRIPELYFAVLGALKARCVVSPLFSAFGPEPIAMRVAIGEGSVMVTTTGLYRRKVAMLRERLPTLKHVLVVRDGLDDPIPEADFNAVHPDRPLRDQLDIDSFDFLTNLEHLHEKIGVNVPQSDYGKMITLDGSVDYLLRRLAEAK